MTKAPLNIMIIQKPQVFRFKDVEVNGLFTHNDALFMKCRDGIDKDNYNAAFIGDPTLSQDFKPTEKVTHVVSIEVATE